MRIEEANRRVFQDAYDHIWDRWGVYVGTYRACFSFLVSIDLVLTVGIVTRRMAVTTPASATVMTAIFTTFTLIALAINWMVYGKAHLGREWRAQRDGDLRALNEEALVMQRIGTPIRIFVIVLCAAWIPVHLEILGNAGVGLAGRLAVIGAGFAGALAYTYTKEVTVRERNESRFAAPKTAHAGGAA